MTKTALGMDNVPLDVRKRFSEQSIKYYQDLLQESSADPTLLYETAVGYRTLGMVHDSWRDSASAEKCFRQAIAILERLVTEHPTVLDYQHQLGFAHFRFCWMLRDAGQLEAGQAELERAQQIYEKLLAEKPDSYDYACELSWVLTDLAGMQSGSNQPEAAKKSCARAVELLTMLIDGRSGPDPDPADANHSKRHLQVWRAKCYEILGQHEQVIAEFSQILVTSPQQTDAWTGRGFAHFDLKQREAAIADFSKAIELDPKNAQSHNTLAWLLATCPDAKLRDPKRAVELAKKAVELAPTEGSFWNTLGIARYRAGEWKDGIEALKKSDELLKGEVSAALNAFFLAMAHWQLGEKEEARKSYEQAVEWMEKNKPQDDDIKRFREEAAELLGVKEKKD